MGNFKIYFLFLLSFLLLNNTFQAQQILLIDSLKNELLKHPDRDTARVNILNELAFAYYRTDLEKMAEYIDESYDISTSIGYKKGEGKCIYYQGIAAMMQSKFEEAKIHFQKAIHLYTSIDYHKGLAACYNAIGAVYNYSGEAEQALEYYKKAIDKNIEIGLFKDIAVFKYNIGNIYVNLGKYDDANTYFEEALSLFENKKHKTGVANTLIGMAVVQKNQGNYPLALATYTKSLVTAEEIKDTTIISNCLNNIGLIYSKQDQHDKALQYFNKALIIQKNIQNKRTIAAIKNNIASIYIDRKEFYKAIDYLEEVLELAKATNNQTVVSDCLHNFGYIHFLLNDYNKAIRYYNEAKTIDENLKDKKGICKTHLGLAEVYLAQKNYDAALTNTLESIKLADSLDFLTAKIDAHEFLSEIYEYKGEYEKAFINHQHFKALNDSFFNKESIEKIAQIENEYKYKQTLDSANIRELELTKTVLSTSRNLEKTRRNLLLGVIAFLVTTLFLGSTIFRQKLRNEKSKIDNILVEQKLMRSQMTPHFIFNSLSVLQGMILNKEEQKSVSYLSKFSRLLRIVLENSRDKTVVLEQELDAINNYLALQNLENENYSYTLNIDDEIDTSALKVPPMLIQPFVENAIEHAFTNEIEHKKIDIHLTFKNSQLICKIIDNGIGINAQKENKNTNKKSLSTLITSERFDLLSKYFKMKGSIKIEDRNKFNEQGTIVTLLIPYLKN